MDTISDFKILGEVVCNVLNMYCPLQAQPAIKNSNTRHIDPIKERKQNGNAIVYFQAQGFIDYLALY